MHESYPFFDFEDARLLLRNKYILFIGDSVVRMVYKDLVGFLQSNMRVPLPVLRRRGENSSLGDRLLSGGIKGPRGMHDGKSFAEEREYKTPTNLIKYYFISRSWYSHVQRIIEKLSQDHYPDIVILGSCLWDITRYGPSGFFKYPTNLRSLFETIRQVMPVHTLVIWAAAMPVRAHITGGLLRCSQNNFEFMGKTLRADVLLANNIAKDVVDEYGFDLIDFHSEFRRWTVYGQLDDGIHWNEKVHRTMTFMLLDHIKLAWDIRVPIKMFFQNAAA